MSVPENSREIFSSSYSAISLLPAKIKLKQLKCFIQKIKPFHPLEQGLHQGQRKASFLSLWKLQFAQILRWVCIIQMCILQKRIRIGQSLFPTLCLHRAISSPRKRKATLGRMCPSQLYGTRNWKAPFLHVQLPLQPPDATAALECEPGAAAAALPIVPYWGMDITQSLITWSYTTSSPEHVSFGRG